MRPILLSIEGINSFQEKQTIDFEALSESGLFCISGPTGSGKTTILDCIILSLYGTGSRSEILADYINLGKDHAEVVFEFQFDHVVYRVERTLYRDAGKHSKCKLFNITENVRLADQRKEADAILKELIGLSREDFTQVVLLEQGKFSKFLNAKKAVRNDTVGNLFKLDQYKNLKEKFNEQKKRLDNEKTNLSERLIELGSVTKQSIQDQKAFFKQQTAVLLKKQDEQTAVANELELMAVNRSKWEAAQTAKARLAELEQLRTESDARKKIISVRLETLAAAGKDIDGRKTILEQQKLQMQSLTDLRPLMEDKQRKEQLRGELREIYKQHSAALSGFRIRSSQLLTEQQELVQSYNQCVAVIEKNFALQKPLVLRLAIAVLSEVAAVNASGEGSDSMERGFSVMLPDVLSWMETVDDARARLAEVLAEITDTLQQYNICAQTIAGYHQEITQLEKQEKEASDFWERTQKEIKSNGEALRGSEAQCARSEQNLEACKQENRAAALQAGLKEGDLCPVCGQKAGVIPYKSVMDFSRQEQQLAQNEREREQLTTRKYGLEKLIAQTDERITNLRFMRSAQQSGLAEMEQKMRTYREKLKGQAPAGSLESVGIEAQSILLDIKKRLSEQFQISRDAESSMLRRTEAERDGRKLTQEIETIRSQIILRAQSEDVAGKQKELKQLIMEGESIVDEHERSCKEVEMLLTENRIAEASLAAEIKSCAVLAAETALFDKQKYESRRLDKKYLEEEITALTQQSAKTEYLILDMEKRLELKREIQTKEKIINGKLDQLQVILKLLRKHSFLEFIAEEYIVRFTEVASETLREISNGKYVLEYGADGSFYVRDFLMGNELRKVSTLSGGETFLASLSMAIAISREIASYKSYEFFFLDEGFGTLDHKSLETVIGALESLSRDTLVGIVTHRSELVDFIPCKLLVQPADERTGSMLQLVF